MPHGQEVRSPGDFIREEMKQRGWTQTDLARILERPFPTVNRILNGKHAILPEMAAALGSAFGNDPEIWMQREAKYRLSLLKDKTNASVAKRARLYDLAPIKEMAKRGWLSASDDLSRLESELLQFFGLATLDDEPQAGASLRSSIDGPINPNQRAWCFRAKQLAQSIHAERFTKRSFERGVKELRKLAAWPEEVRKVPVVLAEMGVRFMVIEPLPSSRIDGAALWIEDKPVIALSVRFDRIDSFWHTLGHELSHIRHRDGWSVDVDIVGEKRPTAIEKSKIEQRADEEAAALLIDQDVLEDFITRVGPMYSRSRINQLANLLRVHPGIIVGQLQFRSEIRYSAMRNTLAKIRDFVTSTALTDGWGHTTGN